MTPPDPIALIAGAGAYVGRALVSELTGRGARVHALETGAEFDPAAWKPQALGALWDTALGWPHLRVVGLMAIPAVEEDPASARSAFARLRALRDDLGEPRPDPAQTQPGIGASSPLALSMGMSADFEVAIEAGATIIRVGTALFGARDG